MVYLYYKFDNFITVSIYNQKTDMRNKNRANKSECFRLLDNQNLPKINKGTSRYDIDLSPEKEVERIVKSQQYVYIDLDQQTGCKAMQKWQPNISGDEQVQKLGNNYVWNLKNLSNQNQLTIDYLHKVKQSQKQKQSIRKLVKNQLDDSIAKLNKRKNYKLDYQKLKQKRQIEFDPLRLKELVQQNHLQSLNEDIWLKQKKLLDKFGISNNYISVSPQHTHRRQKSVLKGKLPALNFKTINT